MGNMSYCRFQNTLADLLDCQEHMDDKLSGEEERARDRLIEACKEIAETEEVAERVSRTNED
ncbi:hypothetical protein ACFLQL_00595 [Verrucomicrobiota bacterium]